MNTVGTNEVCAMEQRKPMPADVPRNIHRSGAMALALFMSGAYVNPETGEVTPSPKDFQKGNTRPGKNIFSGHVVHG